MGGIVMASLSIYRGTVVGLSSVAMLVSACSNDTPPKSPEDYRPPEEVSNATVVWSAEPRLNLFSPQSELARGAQEADIVSTYAGLEDSYPGYKNALTSTSESQGGAPADRVSVFGTIRGHIVDVKSTTHGFTAQTCVLATDFARKEDGRYLRDQFRYGRTIDFVEVGGGTVGPHIGLPDAKPPHADPQWESPESDLFEGWEVKYLSNDADLQHECERWALTVSPDAPQSEDNKISTDTPPQTLPAYPGW